MENTIELVQNAQDRQFTEFDSKTKEILAQKVAAAMDAKGYFDRLNNAKNVTEGENPFAKKDDKDKDDKDKDDKDDDSKKSKDDKDSDEDEDEDED